MPPQILSKLDQNEESKETI